MDQSLIIRNVKVDGHRTSLRMEQETWDALEEICIREGTDVHQVCTMIDKTRGSNSRPAAIRAFVISYYRILSLYQKAEIEHGHLKVGHGSAHSSINRISI